MKHSAVYLPDTPLLAEAEWQLLGVGIHEANPAGIIHRPLGMAGFLFTVFHFEVAVRLQGIEHRAGPSSLVIWEPRYRHYYGNTGGGWDYSWLHCTGPLVEAQLKDAHLPTNTLLPLGDAVDCEAFFQEIRHECAGGAPEPDIIRHLFTLWCLRVGRAIRHPQTDQRMPGPWLALKQYLDEHFVEPITLEMLVERMSLSQPHFSRLYKRYFDMTPMEYLRRVRLEHARFLLNNQNLSIQEVARRVGYDNYPNFSKAFSEYFGVNPRAMRKGMSGDEARRRLVEERRSAEFARWTREGWSPVRHLDYSTATSAETDWEVCYYYDFEPNPLQLIPAPELAEVAEGAMRLRVRNAQSWTALRYRHAVDEEVKIVVQVRNTPPDGPNLAIAISGDLQTGYRLRIDGYHQIDLETIQHGYWEMLQRCAFTLDARADAYTFVLWRADNVFYAEVNGERIMTYEEPFAAQGATHRTIGLGRYGVLGDALIDSVHLWSRRSPRYVDILEPGRVLLRHGHREDALRWFQRIAEEHQEASLQHEAAYLVALATPDTEEAVKDAALQRVTSDSENPFRTRALREHALLRLRRGDFAGAVESAVQLQALTPDAGLVQHLANSLVSVVKTVGREAQAPVLTCLAALPLTLLQLSDAPLVSLEDLRGMRLTHLACWPGYIDDLSPVADMPLTNLTCDNNQLTALTPLAGMSLTACSVARNAITDLSPLAGMPLTTLTCNDNRIEHLTPLRGMPLQALNCSGNLVRDLSPLAGAPLTVLSCAENQIQEVRALAASPLERLDCTLNPISDFTPLPATLQVLYCTATRITDLRGIAHLALREFACGMNRLTDLRPLAAMPLSCLYCEGNPITDLTPLAHLPLAILGIGTIPLTPANGEALAALPLRELGADCLDEAMLALIAAHPTLHIVNAHVRDHVLRVAPTAYAALTAWRNNPSIPLDHRYALRPVAAAMGERAYLSLPIRLPRQEAIAFCRWQGGTLVSPATEVQNTALLQYLTPIVQSASPVCHYLGITIDAEARTLRWHSGAPYAWHRWQSPEEHLFRAHRGHPTFISNITHRYHIWWETEWTPLYPMYTIIEWT